MVTGKLKKGVTSALLIIAMILSLLVTVLPQSTYAASKDMNVNAWLASCKAVTNRIADQGGFYLSKGCPTAYYEKKFYKKTLGSKKVYLNCADYACWCLQKYGIMPAGKRYYTQGYTVRTFPGKKSNYMKNLKKLQTIYIAKKGVKASTLVKKTGTKSLKKGDIISVVKSDGSGHHLMIYAGKVNGKMTYYQVSKACTKTGKNGSTLVRSKMQTLSVCTYGEPRVAMIWRIKGLDYTDSYKVTTSAGENGAIGASRNVSWDGTTTIGITPNEGYQIESLKVDGKTVSISKTATSYTLKNVKAKHTVAVTFSAIPGYQKPETTEAAETTETEKATAESTAETTANVASTESTANVTENVEETKK